MEWLLLLVMAMMIVMMAMMMSHRLMMMAHTAYGQSCCSKSSIRLSSTETWIMPTSSS
jgi:hypothetical protein